MKDKNQDLINYFESLDGEILKDEQMLLTSTFGGHDFACGSNGYCTTNNCKGGNCSSGCGNTQDDSTSPVE